MVLIGGCKGLCNLGDFYGCKSGEFPLQLCPIFLCNKHLAKNRIKAVMDELNQKDLFQEETKIINI